MLNLVLVPPFPVLLPCLRAVPLIVPSTMRASLAAVLLLSLPVVAVAASVALRWVDPLWTTVSTLEGRGETKTVKEH